MTIGERLRQERRAANLTQQKLAEIGAVKISAQKNYEKGTTYPNARYLAACCSEIDVSYVVTGIRTGNLIAQELSQLQIVTELLDAIGMEISESEIETRTLLRACRTRIEKLTQQHNKNRGHDNDT